MEVGDDSANEGSNEIVKGVWDDSFETVKGVLLIVSGTKDTFHTYNNGVDLWYTCLSRSVAQQNWSKAIHDMHKIVHMHVWLYSNRI